MKLLYDSSKKVSSYDASSYKDALESISGTDFTKLFDALVYGTQDFSPSYNVLFLSLGGNTALKNQKMSHGYMVSKLNIKTMKCM